MDTVIHADVSLGIAPDTITFVLDNRPTVLRIDQAEKVADLLPDALALAKRLQPPSRIKFHATAEEPLSEPAIGAPFMGGFFAGYDMDDKRYAIIIAPRAEGHFADVTWSQALEQCKSVRAGGFDDWRAPTKDELYVIYRGLGPNVTQSAAFKKGQSEAFDERWYWSSTEYGSDYAWDQGFDDGYLGYDGKDHQDRVRAVRKVLI
jgi:hypothetical protein